MHLDRWLWKQYKGKINFRMVADSLSELGVIADHNFVAHSHFNDTHDESEWWRKT